MTENNHCTINLHYSNIITNYLHLKKKSDEDIKKYKNELHLSNGDNMFNYAYLIECANNFEALIYYKMSAELGNSDAMTACFYYLIGHNHKEEGMKYLRMALNKYNSNALTCYAYFLETQNKESAIKYYKLPFL